MKKNSNSKNKALYNNRGKNIKPCLQAYNQNKHTRKGEERTMDRDSRTRATWRDITWQWFH